MAEKTYTSLKDLDIFRGFNKLEDKVEDINVDELYNKNINLKELEVEELFPVEEDKYKEGLEIEDGIISGNLPDRLLNIKDFSTLEFTESSKAKYLVGRELNTTEFISSDVTTPIIVEFIGHTGTKTYVPIDLNKVGKTIKDTVDMFLNTDTVAKKVRIEDEGILVIEVEEDL